MENLIVRPTNEADWETLKAIRLNALQDAPKAFAVSYADAARYTDEEWRERAASRKGPVYFLAWRNGEPVGMSGGVVNPDGEYELIAMWVKPAARGSAAATRLVEAVLARATALGREEVVLSVEPENLRASAFYRRQGFVFGEETEPLDSYPEIIVQKMSRQLGA